MAIKQIELPLYGLNSNEETDVKVTITEFAGRMEFIVQSTKGLAIIRFECHFDDIERAWKAVKKY
jgi:hypothetical protein